METTLARKIIESGGEVKTFTTPNSHSKIFGHFNPSILNDRGSLHVISRVCNYTLFHSELSDTIVEGRPLHYVGEDNSIFETTNHFTYIDSKYLKPLFTTKVFTDEHLQTEPQWHFSGLEDVRLVRWNESYYMCGTRRDTESTGIGRMEMSRILVEHAYSHEVERIRIPLPEGEDSYCEKNWMPILSKPFHFVKWTNPTVVVRYDIESKTTHIVTSKEPHEDVSQDLRGGSQVIDWGEDRYLGIVHQPYHTYLNGAFDNEYKQQFIEWDSDWNIVRKSPQFSVMGARIEFVSGLTTLNDDVIITFGYQDNSSFIARVSKKFVEEFLNG
tara:strand:- start:1810 stop:2793 length:984 start_codon:yes stop_codon:yes gene_type:complete